MVNSRFVPSVSAWAFPQVFSYSPFYSVFVEFKNTVFSGVLYRIADGFTYGLLSRGEKESNRQKAKYERMMDEDVDGTLVRMFEAFMQAAPQMVLQFYIMSQLQLDAGPLVCKSHNSLSETCISLSTHDVVSF